jgi:hypothetical protein
VSISNLVIVDAISDKSGGGVRGAARICVIHKNAEPPAPMSMSRMGVFDQLAMLLSYASGGAGLYLFFDRCREPIARYLKFVMRLQVEPHFR